MRIYSGMGLLLLSLTNRFARPIDKIRQLVDRSCSDDKERQAVKSQIDILYRRAKILRLAIVCIASSIFLMCLTMILIFCSYVFGVNVSALTQVCLFVGLILPVIGLASLIADVSMALQSLEIEIRASAKID